MLSIETDYYPLGYLLISFKNFKGGITFGDEIMKMSVFRCKYKENTYIFKDNKWWFKAGEFGLYISEVKNESVLRELNDIMEKELNV